MVGITELLRRSVPLPPTPAWRLIGGALSGLFGGLVGNQGGIRAAALLGFRLQPRQIVATATASALLVDAARVPIYFVSAGQAIVDNARLWIVASVWVTIGTFIGVPLLRRLPERAYRPLVGGLLLILGLSPAFHNYGDVFGRRGARIARREEEECPVHLTDEQRSEAGCIGGRDVIVIVKRRT